MKKSQLPEHKRWVVDQMIQQMTHRKPMEGLKLNYEMTVA